jgi:asparagine synthase (glutamine-hydrolysing)
MSALFGLWHKNGAPVADALAEMEHALCEWQCDWRGTSFDAPAMAGDACLGIGARLLWTTPESRFERAPFTLADFPQLTLAADAWLDNRAALCDTFHIPHPARATTCDSELILRAYAKWGDACAEKLRGDFAFALWDARKEQWYCARDFLGARPFFYFDAPHLFCFASDVRGVLACPGAPAKLDSAMLAAFLTQSTLNAEKRHTFYQNIFKIPPAHFLIVRRGATRLTRYWQPDDAPTVTLPTRDAYVEHARAFLTQAVCDATRGIPRVGAHLSGGLDSTVIAILAARNLQTRGQVLNGYSWSPPPSFPIESAEPDERAFIEWVCAREKIAPHYVRCAADDVIHMVTRDLTRVPSDMALREERVQDAAQRAGVRVLLSGWGGDELLSYSGRGYLPDLLRRGAWREWYGETTRRVPPHLRGARRVRAYGSLIYRQMLWQLLPNWVWEIHSPYGKRRTTHFIQPAFFARERAAAAALRDVNARDFPSVRATQTARLEAGHLTRRMESWATHGAKRGIVYRYPLLTRPLVEFVLGLPPHLYFDNGYARAMMRHVARELFPADTHATRTKQEPAAMELVMDTLHRGTRALYQHTRPRFETHPAKNIVNTAAIERVMSTPGAKRNDPFVQRALACFYFSALER